MALEKSKIQNKQFWRHHTIPGRYLPQETAKGFSLSEHQRMEYFTSKQEALSKGWKPEEGKREGVKTWDF